MTHPLATPEQQSCEARALRLLADPEVRAARERARAILLADPVATTRDGALGLDRALDHWMTALAMREINGDPARPMVIWNVDNTPRTWFGHTYPGAAVAVDNPDNINREMPIDGDGRYELTIRFAENPSSLSLVMEVSPDHHAGIGENLATIDPLKLDPQPGREVRVSVDSEPPGDRPYHLQTRAGARIQLYARDSHADWGQSPATLSIRRLDLVPGPGRGDDEIRAAIVAAAVPFVRFWCGFKDGFLGHPEPNRLVGPVGRVGGWGFLAGGRFQLGPCQGLMVVTGPTPAQYCGFQIADPFTIAPDPVYRTSSLNTAQATTNADGSRTYLLAATDVGAINWIDTVGLQEGWMLLRWQGVPPDADPATFIREVRLVDLSNLPDDLPRTALSARCAALRARVAQHHARTRVGDPA